MIKRFKNKYLCDYSLLIKLVYCFSYFIIDRRLYVYVLVNVGNLNNLSFNFEWEVKKYI